MTFPEQSRIEAILTVILTSIFIVPLIVLAHQSGCHRWHSCPSDSGSYICGDTGNCSSCPDNNYCKNGNYFPNSSTNTPTPQPTPISTPTLIPTPQITSTVTPKLFPTVTPIFTPTLTPKPTILPTSTSKPENNVMTNVQNSQFAYYRNPHWFREKLIDDLIREFGSQYSDIIAKLVYTLLPDVKN